MFSLKKEQNYQKHWLYGRFYREHEHVWCESKKPRKYSHKQYFFHTNCVKKQRIIASAHISDKFCVNLHMNLILYHDHLSHQVIRHSKKYLAAMDRDNWRCKNLEYQLKFDSNQSFNHSRAGYTTILDCTVAVYIAYRHRKT